MFGKDQATAPLYTLGSCPLRFVTEGNYLGIAMRSHFKFNKHIITKTDNVQLSAL